MGADARWVCHTCKTVCNRGGRPLTRYGVGITKTELNRIKRQLTALQVYVELDDFARDMILFLDDLSKWLSRHEGHNIHIGSDYTTDMMDLDDYHNESVDGKVSDCTRYEARCKSVNEWRQTSINEIKGVITNYGPVDEGILDQLAAELYDKFSMKAF